MKLGFDLDGVICEGKYLTQPERASEAYMALKPLAVPWIWNKLCDRHDVYIITARSYPGAVDDVYQWLTDNNLDLPAGVMCGEPHFTHEAMVIWKRQLVLALGLKFYIDDSPQIYKELASCWANVYLMNNFNWPENQNAGIPTIASWKEINTEIDRIST